MTQLAQVDALTPAPDWWSTATSGPGLWLVVAMAACAALLIWLGVRLRAVSEQSRRPATVRERLADDGGVAMVEFVLVTPILLLVTLLLLQTMLVFTGLFYVQHAAFAAARSAIVQIPMASTEPQNEIYLDLGSDKFEAIQAAAVFAVMPVSGREDGASVVAGEVAAGVAEVFAAQGESAPPWVDRLLAERLTYAINHTEVTLERVTPSNDAQSVDFEAVEGYATFSPKEAIAARVRHEFALSIPLASRVFSAIGISGTYNPASRNSDNPAPPGTWTLIESRAILTNEGIDRRLPPAPEVPRL